MRDELWMKHDARSREDGKMRWFLKRTHMEGYGFFWGIIEKLHYQNDHTIPLTGPEFEGIADDLFLTPERLFELCSLAHEAGLFKIENGVLWQKRLSEEQAKRTEAQAKWTGSMQALGRRGGQASAAKRREAQIEQSSQVISAAILHDDIELTGNRDESESNSQLNNEQFEPLVDKNPPKNVVSEESEQSSQLNGDDATEARPKRTLDREIREKREIDKKEYKNAQGAKFPPGYREGCQTFGEYRHVYLTSEEFQKLCSDFGQSAVNAKITSLDSNIENSVPKYVKFKQHAACVRNWCTSDKASGKVPREEPLPNGFTWVDRNNVRGPDGKVNHVSFVRNIIEGQRLEALKNG